MDELNAWGRVTGIVVIHDPKERELADRFNRAATQIFKHSARTEKRALVEMLRVAEGLYSLKAKEDLDTCIANYEAGFKRGAGLGRGMAALDGIKASVDIFKRGTEESVS